MFDRAWILSILAQLPAFYWPVFLWDCWQVSQHVRAYGAANPQGGMISIGVTRKGRVHIIWQMAGDAPSETDWTRHAPRAPWIKLDPDAFADALISLSAAPGPSTCLQPETGPESADNRPVPGPLLLDPG
ncbi:MAG: hypothetical protein RLN72_05495 [Henriciella sp.]